jgi:hypothetical protein
VTGQRTQELIHELGQDLSPVRPIPSLRRVLLGVLALWALVAVPGVLLRGLRPDFLETLLAARAANAVFGVLALSGLGGIVAALALGVPGREWLARAGLGLGLLGLALAAGLGTLLVLWSPHPLHGLFQAGDLSCLGVACGVALIPAAGVVWFVGRAAPYRPLVAVLAAAAGMAALGAAAAQASCPYADPRHLLVGHVLAPALGAILLTLPLLLALRRFGRPRVE